MATEEQNVAAIRAALESVDAVPYTVQDSKRVVSLPPAYNRITVEPRFGGVLNLAAQSGRRGVRIAVRSIGNTYERASQMRDLADQGLRYAVLVVGEVRSTPVQFESANPIEEPEAGWHFGDSFYTYVL